MERMVVPLEEEQIEWRRHDGLGGRVGLVQQHGQLETSEGVHTSGAWAHWRGGQRRMRQQRRHTD